MRFAVTGSRGLVGSALTRRLEEDGHGVLRLVRGPEGGPGEVSWDPAAGRLDPAALGDVEAVFHLAGAGIAGRRWTPGYKELIRTSRVDGTATVARALARLGPGRTLVSVSAVGYYGADPGPGPLGEDAPAGTDFLARLCSGWEAAADPARDAGVRVVHPRMGLVLSAAGGVLRLMLPAFRLGAGARLGSGRQYMSWVTRDDVVSALLHVATEVSVSGPVNVTAPEPVTNRQFTAGLARALHRPAVLGIPAPVLRVALGREMADETLLAGQRAVPERLQHDGFRFAHPDAPAGIRAALADRQL